MAFNAKQRAAMKHPNKLGAGSKARKGLHGQEKVGVVMHEYKHGTLHSGSGEIVKNRDQAIAIAMSEAGLSKKKHFPSKSTRPKGSGLPSDSDYAQGFIRLETGDGQGNWIEQIPLIGPAIKALKKQKKRIEQGSPDTGQTKQQDEE